jgi:hypothetical protein
MMNAAEHGGDRRRRKPGGTAHRFGFAYGASLML